MAEFAEVYLIGKHFKEAVSFPFTVNKVESEHVCADGLKHLEGRTVKGIYTKGKMIIFETEDDNSPFIVRVMFNGSFVVDGNYEHVQKYNLIKSDRPYRFLRGKLHISTGQTVNFFAQRPIIRYEETKEKALAAIYRQAPDLRRTDLSLPDLPGLTYEHFYTTLKKKKGLLVQVLRDQNNLCAGIGNYMVSELLFKCRFGPYVKCTDLTDEEIFILWARLQELTEDCFKYQADYSKYIKVFAQRKTVIDGITYNVKYIKAGSNTVYFIPELLIKS